MPTPFAPNAGAFAQNIRSQIPPDDTELRESLRGGWIEHFPALVDENGVVLVGHRRLRLAEELGIEPVIKRLTLGNGKNADAERLRVAFASNIGAPVTRQDRKHIAEVLYQEPHQWTMPQIAEALGVTAMTISNDLRGFKTALKPHRPKGGRPKTAKPRQRRAVNAARETVNRRHATGEPITRAAVAAETGVGEHSARIAIAQREAEVRVLGEALDHDFNLSATAQQRLDTAIRVHKASLDRQFEDRVRQEVTRQVEELRIPHVLAKLAEMERMLASPRFAVMKKAEFNKINRCLHTDTARHVSDAVLTEAFQIFNRYKPKMVNDQEEREDTMRKLRGGLPTFEQMMARRNQPRQRP